MTIARILAAKGRDVVTTQPHRTLAEVAEVLVAKNIGAVVVADVQGSVIGILSERDIVRAVAKRGTAVFNDAVSKRMTAVVITTSEVERVHVAMEKMTNGWFRHLPVIRHDNLIGLVSIGDLVKASTRRVGARRLIISRSRLRLLVPLSLQLCGRRRRMRIAYSDRIDDLTAGV